MVSRAPTSSAENLTAFSSGPAVFRLAPVARRAVGSPSARSVRREANPRAPRVEPVTRVARRRVSRLEGAEVAPRVHPVRVERLAARRHTGTVERAAGRRDESGGQHGIGPDVTRKGRLDVLADVQQGEPLL